MTQVRAQQKQEIDELLGPPLVWCASQEYESIGKLLKAFCESVTLCNRLSFNLAEMMSFVENDDIPIARIVENCAVPTGFCSVDGHDYLVE